MNGQRTLEHVMKKALLLLLALFACSTSYAAGYCDLQPGFRVTTHGNNSDSVWLYGALVGQSSPIWIPISNGTAGKANVAVALAAQVSGRGLSVYLDLPEHTCANFPNWNGAIRHVQITD
jgi:hypothetical protein